MRTKSEALVQRLEGAGVEETRPIEIRLQRLLNLNLVSDI